MAQKPWLNKNTYPQRSQLHLLSLSLSLSTGFFHRVGISTGFLHIFFFSFGGNMQQLLCILSLPERYISYSTELQYPTVTSKYLLISCV